MLLPRLIPTLPLVFLIGFTSISTCTPFQHLGTSDSPEDSRILALEEYTDFAPALFRCRRNRCRSQSNTEAIAALLKRNDAAPKGYHLIHRRQQSALIPGASGIAALKGFWQTISMKALYNNVLGEAPKSLFTISKGILQATFSCLGQEVPWDFVQSFAMNVVGMVDMGWTDTFDALYESETGVTLWVSLRVLVKARKKTKPNGVT